MLKVQPDVESSLRRNVNFQSHLFETLENMIPLVFEMLLKGQTLGHNASRFQERNGSKLEPISPRQGHEAEN